MFVGHYAAALAAKSAEPRAPLWTLVAGCQLLDIGWSGLVIAGIEKFRFNPSLPGSNLDLYFMPYTHSLPASLAWSAAAAVLARTVLRLPWRVAAVIGCVVFSHWLLDLLAHRPDLDLGFGGPKLGFALWNLPVPEMVVEMGLLALAAAAWTATVKTAGLRAWPAVLFTGLLVTVQAAVTFLGASPPSSTTAMGIMALAIYLVVTGLSLFFDRPGARRIRAR